MTNPPHDSLRRRVSDKKLGSRIVHVIKRENWYRDIWLFIISAFMVWSVAILQTNADDAKHLATQIQVSRVNQCHLDNIRHDDAIKAFGNLNETEKTKDLYVHLFLSAGVKLTPRSKASLRKFVETQLQSQSQGTIALINAVAPHRDCSFRQITKQRTHQTRGGSR